MQRIFEVIREYHMIDRGMRVIAGISGGADSVCLLYVLQEYRKQVPFELLAVHVEHGLRGEESLEDARFTQQLCQRFDVPCKVVSAAVQQVARERGLSLEEAGRMERYRIFEEIRTEWKADRVALAHNQNDQAETVLWNLVRGSGLKGLGGIRPVREEKVRPLIFTARSEIEQILIKAGISWRTDRTNLETDYTRNRIRLSVLPQMERELNERATEHIAQAAGRLQEMQELLERMTEQAAQRCMIDRETQGSLQQNSPTELQVIRMQQEKRIGEKQQKDSSSEVVLYLPQFQQEEKLIRQELLRYVLSRIGGLKDIGAVHIQMLEELSRMDCGKECHLPGGIRAVRERDTLRMIKEIPTPDHTKSKTKTEYLLPIPGTLYLNEIVVKTQLYDNCSAIWTKIQEEKKYTKWLSYDTINSNVCLRKRQAGDYLVVNAQGGRKKLKDYLIDNKIPKEERDRIWLLADGSHILWIIGYRISEAAKVGRDTKHVLEIQMKEEER